MITLSIIFLSKNVYDYLDLLILNDKDVIYLENRRMGLVGHCYVDRFS